MTVRIYAYAKNNVKSVSVPKRIIYQCLAMKRIIEWMEKKLSRPEVPVVDEQPSKPLTVDDLLTPDIYAEVKTTTEILDLSSPDSNKKRGFNPYDTGVLRKK